MGIKTCLLMGYTGRCTIGFVDDGSEEEIQVFLTSYSLSINTNILKSGAAYKLSDYTNNYPDFKRIGLNVVKDYPNYQISISFELTKSVFDKLINELCKYFHQPLKISLSDEISGFGKNYTFDNCYVNQFSFNVQNGAVATASLNAVYYKDYIQFSSTDYSAKAIQSSILSQIGNVFLPYYNWDVDYPFIQGKVKSNLKSFSFSFSHQITPKYSCCTSNSSSTIALSPSKIVFSVPSMTYQLTYIYYDLFNNFNDSSTTANNVFNNSNNSDNNKLTIKYSEKNELRGVEVYSKTIVFTYCYPDTYTPNLANSGDVNSITISGTIYGSVE